MSYLKVIQPKTRPVLIEPWLFRYLSNNEIKVVSAILSYADIKDRKSNSFPSNKTIAFYCGYDLIEKSTSKTKNVTYIKYQALTTIEEKQKFKAKKIAHAINTVKATKRSLIAKGILKTEIVGEKGKQITYMTLDLEWKKEQYLQEHNEFFNNIVTTADDEDVEKWEIKKELEQLIKLTEENSINKDNLLKRLEELTKSKKSSFEKENIVPVEDIDKITDFIMDNNKVKTKIENGKIGNKVAYKKAIKNSIENNTYTGVEETYIKLVKKEKEEIFNTLETALIYNEETIPFKSKILHFENLRFTNNIFIARYSYHEDNSKLDFIVGIEKIKNYLPTPNTYTKQNKELLENYEEGIKKYQEDFQNKLNKEDSS